MKKKILGGIVAVALALLLFILQPEQVSAANSITGLPTFHYANQSKTPSSNTFIMRFGKDTKIDSAEGEYENGYFTVDGSTPVSSVMVRHVGFYQGKDVDVKITLQKSKGSLDGGSIKVGDADYFLGIDIRGEMRVTYEFFDQEGQPLEVETAFNYQGLNSNKYIGFLNPDHIIKAVYANNPTNILYDTWRGSTTDYWIYFKNNTRNTPWLHPTQSLEVATNAASRIDTVVHNNDSTTSSLVYYTDFLAQPEFSPADAVSKTDDRADQVALLATQTMPSMTNSSRMQQLKLSFGADLAKAKQYEIAGVSVTNFNGDDLTDKFVSQPVTEEEWSIEAKNAADDSLYDTTLKYQLQLKWIGSGQQPVDPQLLQDNQLPLNFYVQSTINGEASPSSKATDLINYLGEVQVQLENQTGEPLQEPISKTGYLTSAFDVTDVYPGIPGYYPIKEALEADRGFFVPEIQKIQHHYAKGEPIRFSLTDAENPLLIPRFSHSRKLAFNIQRKTKDPISLLVKCGDEIQKLKEYPAGDDEISDTIDFKAKEDWLDKEVQFYVESASNQRSNSEIRHLKTEDGPQLALPPDITFGQQEIPAENRHIPAANQTAVSVQDDSKWEKSRWTVKVKEQTPLTNEQQQTITKALSFQKGKQQIWLNNEYQAIWSGTGPQKLADVGNLILLLRPSDETGSYHGILGWTLEDAPE